MNNKVAVIFPVSKGDIKKYVKLAIESVLEQTYKDFSFIVCKDGEVKSGVDTYLNSINDERLILISNNENMGLPYTLNHMIKEYPADIYIRMDADDICRNDRFEILLNEFTKNPDYLLIGSECVEIDENGNEIFYKKMPSKTNDIKKWSFTRNPFIHPSVAFRQKFIDEVGFYNEKILKSQDYELWARAILKNIKMTNIHLPLISFRISDKFWKKRGKFINIKNEMKVSLNLITKLNGYKYFPLIITKLLSRIMPSFINKFIYKYFR